MWGGCCIRCCWAWTFHPQVPSLILAVRNISNGETIQHLLISDPEVKSINPNFTIKDMNLDTDNYSRLEEISLGVGSRTFRSPSADVER